MCVCVCVCVYYTIYLHAHTHTRTHAHTRAHTQTFTHTHTHTHFICLLLSGRVAFRIGRIWARGNVKVANLSHERYVAITEIQPFFYQFILRRPSRLCVCVCVYVYTYVCMFVRMHVCMHSCIRIHVCMHACMHVYIHVYTYAYIYYTFSSSSVGSSMSDTGSVCSRVNNSQRYCLSFLASRSAAPVSDKFLGGINIGATSDM